MLIVVLVCALLVLVLALTWIRRRRPVYVGDPTPANIDWPIDIDTPVVPIYDAPAKKSFWTKGKIAGAAVFSALALGGLAYAGHKATWFRRDEDPGSRVDVELGPVHSHAPPEGNAPTTAEVLGWQKELQRNADRATFQKLGGVELADRWERTQASLQRRLQAALRSPSPSPPPSPRGWFGF
jgi:hypothetical protein